MEVRVTLALVAMFTVIAFASIANADGPDPDDTPTERDTEPAPHTTESSATLTMGGVTIPIEEGYRMSPEQAIAHGAKRSEEGCDLPQTFLSGRLTATSNVGHITAVIGTDCSITISEIAFTQQEASEADASGNSIQQNSTGTHYEGWAKSELNDFVGIDLTSTYAEMHYYDNGTSVYGGHDPEHDCDVFWYPFGWYEVSCDAYWWPHGPSSVYIRQEGVFDHHTIRNARHWQMARFYAAPGWGDYECGHSGSVPGPVHWDCDGSFFVH